MKTARAYPLVWCILLLVLSATVMAQAPEDRAKTEAPKDRAKLELYAEGIRLVHQNLYFYAPYTVQQGDTFASLSEKFYKTREYAVTVSQVNGLSLDQPLVPGSTVYIPADSATLYFAKGQEASQSRTVRDYLSTVKDPAQLTYVWDDADIAMEMTPEGKWILNKYDSAKLRIFDPTTQQPELQLTFKKAPLLDILFGSGTSITGAAVTR